MRRIEIFAGVFFLTTCILSLALIKGCEKPNEVENTKKEVKELADTNAYFDELERQLFNVTEQLEQKTNELKNKRTEYKTVLKTLRDTIMVQKIITIQDSIIINQDTIIITLKQRIENLDTQANVNKRIALDCISDKEDLLGLVKQRDSTITKVKRFRNWLVGIAAVLIGVVIVK